METTGVKVRSEILSPGQNFLFWPSGTMCRCDTLQSAECHPCTLVAECLPGTSDSLRNFTPVVRKVSPQDFLPVLGAPQPKIMNRSFWLSCDQMVLLTGVRRKPGFGHFVERPWVKFSKFWPAELRTFTPMVPKVSLQDFLPLFGAPRPKITNRFFYQRATKRCFWPACDGNLCSVFLTVVRPKKASKIRD